MRIPDVTWKTKRHIVDEIVKAGIKKVTISGGEPTVTKDYVKTLRYMFDNQLSVVLHTNGLRIDRTSAKKIAPLVERVSLSLDGSSKKMCMKVRKNKDIFSNTLRLIDIFNQLKVPVNVKTLVTKVNLEDILNIGKILQNKPITYWSLLEFNPINRGHTNKSKFSIKDSEFDNAVKVVKKNIKSLTIKTRLFKRDHQSYCFIAANGKVYTFIPRKGDVLIGNLKKDGLKKILTNIRTAIA